MTASDASLTRPRERLGTSTRCALVGGAILGIAFAFAMPISLCALPAAFVFACIIAVVVWVLERIVRARGWRMPFRSLAIGFTVLLTLALAARALYEATPTVMFRSMIADPVPSSVKSLSAEESPSFSDGSLFFFRFRADSRDIEAIARQHELDELPQHSELPARYEQFFHNWAGVDRPNRDHAWTGPKLAIEFDSRTGEAIAVVDRLTDPVTRR